MICMTFFHLTLPDKEMCRWLEDSPVWGQASVHATIPPTLLDRLSWGAGTQSRGACTWESRIPPHPSKTHSPEVAVRRASFRPQTLTLGP